MELSRAQRVFRGLKAHGYRPALMAARPDADKGTQAAPVAKPDGLPVAAHGVLHVGGGWYRLTDADGNQIPGRAYRKDRAEALVTGA